MKRFEFNTVASGKKIIVECDLPTSKNSGDNCYIRGYGDYINFAITGSFEIFEFFDMIDYIKKEIESGHSLHNISYKDL